MQLGRYSYKNIIMPNSVRSGCRHRHNWRVMWSHRSLETPSHSKCWICIIIYFIYTPQWVAWSLFTLVPSFLETNIGQFHSKKAKLKLWQHQMTPRIRQQARPAFPAVNGSYYDLTELLRYLKPIMRAADAWCQLMLARFEPAVSPPRKHGG